MNFSGSLLWIVMRPEFIVGDVKLWLRSGWICYSSFSVIRLSFVSSYNSSFLTSVYFMSCSCVLIRWLSPCVSPVVLIRSYRSSRRTEFTFGKGRENVAWGGPVFLYVSFFYCSPLVVIHVCDCSEGFFLWVPFYVCTMVLWMDNYLVFRHAALKIVSHIWW